MVQMSDLFAGGIFFADWVMNSPRSLVSALVFSPTNFSIRESNAAGGRPGSDRPSGSAKRLVTPVDLRERFRSRVNKPIQWRANGSGRELCKA